MLSVFDWVLNVMNEAVCEWPNEWMDEWMDYQLYFYVINVMSECLNELSTVFTMWWMIVWLRSFLTVWLIN